MDDSTSQNYFSIQLNDSNDWAYTCEQSSFVTNWFWNVNCATILLILDKRIKCWTEHIFISGQLKCVSYRLQIHDKMYRIIISMSSTNAVLHIGYIWMRNVWLNKQKKNSSNGNRTLKLHIKWFSMWLWLLEAAAYMCVRMHTAQCTQRRKMNVYKF